MMMVRCGFVPSEIEGPGLFRHDDISKGDIVWRDDRIDGFTCPELARD